MKKTVNQNKSHVALEQKVCPVCGITHSHDCAVLLDMNLRATLPNGVVTGYGLCEKHAKLNQEGFIGLIEVQNDQEQGDTLTLQNADRTGQVAYLKREVFCHMFNVPAEYAEHPFIFVQVGVIDLLKARVEPDESIH